MDNAKRKFVVFNKADGTSVTITGTRLLAKHLGIKTHEVPAVHMLKVTYDQKTVCEVNLNKEKLDS